MPFKFERGKDGSQKVVRIPDKPEFHNSENKSCGVCNDTGTVEEGAFCSCEKGQSLRRLEHKLPKPKISEPPAPTDDQKSAFDQPRPDQGTQLDLFGN